MTKKTVAEYFDNGHGSGIIPRGGIKTASPTKNVSEPTREILMTEVELAEVGEN